MKTIIAMLALLAGILWWRHDPPARWKGMPAARSPVQTATDLPPEFRSGDYVIKPLARYEITAVVLGTERYRVDPSAELAPVDLALGWGPMSVAGVLNELTISQDGRFYEYTYKQEPPLPEAEIAHHSANTHCIPADADVRRSLQAIRRHDLVTLRGLLVEVNRPDGFNWRSSLTREDTRGGACELVWVTEVDRVKSLR